MSLVSMKLFFKKLFSFLYFAFRAFLDRQGLESAKSLTYTSLFAVVPSITLVLAILTVFPSFQDFGSEIQEIIFDRLLPSTSSQIEVYLANFASQARNVTWVGTVMFVVTAYFMLVNVERSFNYIWGIETQRKGLASFLLYWSVLSLGPLLLGVGVGINSYVASLTLFDIFTEVSENVGVNSFLLGFFPVLLTTCGFALLYGAVPNCGVRFKHAFIGGLVVALCFLIVKKVFTNVMATASFGLVYGAFAAIPIFLLWINVCWVVILFGANIVRALPMYHTHNIKGSVHPSILMLALLHKFWDKNQRGESLHINELLDANWPFYEVELDVFLDILKEQKIIHAASEDEYLLIRDLQSLTLWDLLSALPWAIPEAIELDKELPLSLTQELPSYDTLRKRFIKVEGISKDEFAESLSVFCSMSLKAR